MNKTERQDRYEHEWRNRYRPVRRFRRSVRRYWQTNPKRNHWYERYLRAKQAARLTSQNGLEIEPARLLTSTAAA